VGANGGRVEHEGANGGHVEDEGAWYVKTYDSCPLGGRTLLIDGCKSGGAYY
jgi:hypothetical protein